MYSYATIEAFKRFGNIPGASGDKEIRRLLEAATQSVDNQINRTLRTYLDTLYFTPQSPTRLDLDRDGNGLGLLSVTTLKADKNGDRTYGTTWAVTDYDLMPINATSEGKPFWRLEVTPRGVEVFPHFTRGVEIVGKWGYFEDLVRSDSLVAGAIGSATVTTVTVDNGSDFETLQTILIDSEQMYITAINANDLTVARATNGTTGATHADNAVIDVYRYPELAVDATTTQAIRRDGRSGGTGSIGTADGGSSAVVRGMDLDIIDALSEFRLEF